MGKPWHHTVGRHAGPVADNRKSIIEQRRIAAKLVDDKSPGQRAFGLAQQVPGADKLGDHAAAVDIADQHHRHVRRFGETHIGNVGGAQIDFGGAAR